MDVDDHSARGSAGQEGQRNPDRMTDFVLPKDAAELEEYKRRKLAKERADLSVRWQVTPLVLKVLFLLVFALIVAVSLFIVISIVQAG
jgi:hypothetical protein